jgi:hypothetical protein
MKNCQYVRYLLLPVIGMFISIFAGAQEFFCTVQVNSQQIQGTDKRVYESMNTALTEFVNDRRWTNYSFKANERIECTMVITIKDRPSVDQFKATINIVATRPVYGTTYNSTLLNYIDKDFEFEYVEFQALIFQDNQFDSNLTSVIAFYLYVILGIDFDSFSDHGGTPFFEKAQEIVNTAQGTAYTGWSSFDNQRNRYWMAEYYLDNSYSEIRNFMYRYHFKGMDILAEKTQQGRTEIMESLKLLQKVAKERPGLFTLQLIMDAKRDEFVNIFKEGNPTEKTDVIEILKEIDPANSNTYLKINQKS